MTTPYRNPDGTLGVEGIGGHYTCEGIVRRWRNPFRRVQCHAPAVVAHDVTLLPEGFPITFRFCRSCAEGKR